MANKIEGMADKKFAALGTNIAQRRFAAHRGKPRAASPGRPTAGAFPFDCEGHLI
jgi:hypothetical protein